ncbi:hypothetical protein MCHIJ_42790 [Mycolicibacterium chitae]|nr:hypothetical protein MCHIJ_42790 [Mycolicibacterium chitae]
MGDKVFASIDEQFEFAGDLVVSGYGQIRVAQDCAGHGQRVDGVGFALGACAGAFVGHQLRCDPHDLLTRRQQVPLQAR